MRLAEKLILSFLSVALLMLAVGFFAVSQSKKTLKQAIGSKYQMLASLNLSNVDKSIDARIKETRLLSYKNIVLEHLEKSNKQYENLSDIDQHIEDIDCKWRSTADNELTPEAQELTSNSVSTHLKNIAEIFKHNYGYPIAAEIFVTNKYGANIGQTRKTSDYYQADEKWWQSAKKNGLYVSDVEYDESAQVYCVSICLRIDDEQGNFAGVTKVVWDVNEAISIVGQSESFVSEKYPGVNYKLFTDQGNIIYSTNEYDTFADISNEPMVTYSIMAPPGYQVGCDNFKIQDHKMFVYAKSSGYQEFGGLGWVLLIEFDTKEVFAPITRLKRAILAFSGLSVIIAIIVGLLISRSISNPIHKLIKATEQIGRGNLNTKIDIRSKDEIGRLAESFKQMLKDLRTSVNSIQTLNIENAQRINTEQILKNSQAKLKEANKELQHFAYTVSHDLYQPLRKIVSFGQLLEKEIKDVLTEDTAENLRYITEAANRLQKMILALLEYSRITTNVNPFQEVDINDVLTELQAIDLHLMIEQTQANIVVPENLPIIWCDPELIRIMLHNLLNNAMKYCKEDSTAEITIRYQMQNDDMIKIMIEDNGIGIKPEFFDDIFRVFRRLNRFDEFNGTGIGLAICKKIAQRHGGDIGVSSTFGHGSTFWFTIPSNVSKIWDLDHEDIGYEPLNGLK